MSIISNALKGTTCHSKRNFLSSTAIEFDAVQNRTSGIPGGYRLVSTYDLPVFQFGGGYSGTLRFGLRGKNWKFGLGGILGPQIWT